MCGGRAGFAGAGDMEVVGRKIVAVVGSAAVKDQVWVFRCLNGGGGLEDLHVL